MNNNNPVVVQMNNLAQNEAIQKLLDAHLLSDLKITLERRHFYNTVNIYLGIGFEFFSVGGVLVNGVGLSTGNQTLAWIGLSAMGIALFLKNIQKQNTKFLNLSMADIIKMRNGEYVDEGVYVEVDDRKDNTPLLLPGNNNGLRVQFPSQQQQQQQPASLRGIPKR